MCPDTRQERHRGTVVTFPGHLPKDWPWRADTSRLQDMDTERSWGRPHSRDDGSLTSLSGVGRRVGLRNRKRDRTPGTGPRHDLPSAAVHGRRNGVPRTQSEHGRKECLETTPTLRLPGPTQVSPPLRLPLHHLCGPPSSTPSPA